MTKLIHSFKHFANSISIFDLVERHFPFKKYLSDFNKRLGNNPEETFLNSELDRIKNAYENNDGIAAFGYHHKITRRDHSVKTLQLDFIIFSEQWEKAIRLPFRIKKVEPTQEQIDELLEKQFFECIAIGVNDAQLEIHIRKLKRQVENTPSANKNDSTRSEDILKRQADEVSLMLAIRIFFSLDESVRYDIRIVEIKKNFPEFNKTAQDHFRNIRTSQKKLTEDKILKAYKNTAPTTEENDRIKNYIKRNTVAPTDPSAVVKND